MPAALVDPAVQASGSVPASPIGAMMSSAVAAYGKRYPTPAEQAQIQYEQAETQRIQQQMGVGNSVRDITNNIYAPATSGTNTPLATQPTDGGVNASPSNDGAGGGSALPMPSTPQPQPGTPQSRLTSNAGNIFKAAFDSGHPEIAGGLMRAITANAPGIPATGTDVTHPSPLSMSMMGAGDAYGNTPDATLLGGTPGQRDRNAKIADMVSSNPGITRSQAADVVDGVLEPVIDPTTKNVFLVNKLTQQSTLMHTPVQGLSTTPGGTPPAAAPASNTGSNGNNPFNLRPVGATTGFQQFKTPQEGLLAGLSDLSAKLSGHSAAMNGLPPTLRNIIGVYSPPNENQTVQLIQNASQRMGVDPDAPLNLSHLVPLASAILAQEGNTGALNAGAQPGAQAASAQPDASQFSIKRGDLGIPFGSLYGGSATAGRVMGGVSALTGDPNANQGAATGLSKVNDIKNQLIAIKNLQMGMRTNSAAQARFAQQFPETDPQLLDAENLASAATTGSGTAEDQVNAALQGAVGDRIEDAKTFANPNVSAEERQYAQERMNKTDKLFAGLPPTVQAAYAKALAVAPGGTNSNPQAPAAAPAQTNLEKGVAATGGTPGQTVSRPTTQAQYAALPTGSLYIDPGTGKTMRKK